MLPFTYYAPTRMIFGRDTHLTAGEVIASHGYKRVLLHYGGGHIKKTGLYDTVQASLAAAGLSVVELGGVQPNPVLSLVRQGMELCKSEHVELILAVGGGSVIDSAKAIATGVGMDCDPWPYFLKQGTPDKALPVGVMLTLSAAGSEMSASCVISNEDGQLKRGFSADTNRPLFSICNPELTHTVDKYQTACGIVDMMMHTAERFFSDAPPTPLTDELACALLKSVVRAGRVAFAEPNNYNARAELMWASSLSHNDLTGCGRKTTLAVHQLEHEVSGLFPQVAHGAGLAVLFPAWMRVVLPHKPERLAQFAHGVWDIAPSGDATADALAGIAATTAFFRDIEMPDSLSAWCITPDCFDELAEKCTHWGKRNIDGLVPMDKAMLLEILALAR